MPPTPHLDNRRSGVFVILNFLNKSSYTNFVVIFGTVVFLKILRIQLRFESRVFLHVILLQNTSCINRVVYL